MSLGVGVTSGGGAPASAGSVAVAPVATASASTASAGTVSVNPSTAGTAAPSTLSEAVLQVTTNGNDPGEMFVVLRGAGGEFYLEADDFKRLRLPLPAAGALSRDGRRYFDAHAIPGCTVTVDEAAQRAIVDLPAAGMSGTRFSAPQRSYPAITPAAPGAFLNYQLSAQQIEGENTGGAFAELGLFAAAGVLTNTALARYGGGVDQAVRLDTTYTHDFPASLDTLNLGDTISDPGTWGSALRYAGIRWSRNFGLRPDLLTTPLLAAAGTATVPSSVDVFVNRQLVASTEVPAGPFIIDRLPTVSGTGDVNVVVRDALGREQVLTQAFYSSSVLLAQGLSQYSFNLGSVRDDYALASNHYGEVLGEFSYRQGITDAVTLEGHGEYLLHDAYAFGVNAAVGAGQLGVFNVTAAYGGTSGATDGGAAFGGIVYGGTTTSGSAPSGAAGSVANGSPYDGTAYGGSADGGIAAERGSGWLTGAGFEHRGPIFSFVANSSWASSGFAQVGEPDDPELRMRQRSFLQSGVSMGSLGALSLAYVRQTYRAFPTQQTLSLAHSVSLGRAGILNLTITRTHIADEFSGPANSTSAYLMFVMPIDGRRSVTVSAVGGSGPGSPPNELVGSLAQNPPVGQGSAYRLSASSAGNYDADWRQQFRAADVEVEAARREGIDGRSVYASGAVTLLDGQVNATRSVNGSFAVVDLDGLADVPVYVENQLTTHTDASGRALLYNLRPYEANKISIVPEELPLDTTIAASSELLAPAFRSGVIAHFPVERTHGGTFRLVLDDGQPVPTGAMVKLRGSLFPVVLDGVVYVTGFDHGMAAEASWPGNRCNFRLEPPPPGDPLPDMGTIRCQRAPAEPR